MFLAFLVQIFIPLITSVLGFVGYYGRIPVLLTIFFVIYVLEILIGYITNPQSNQGTSFFAALIGLFVALFKDLNIFKTIAICLCYESAYITIITLVSFITFHISVSTGIKESHTESRGVYDENKNY